MPRTDPAMFITPQGEVWPWLPVRHKARLGPVSARVGPYTVPLGNRHYHAPMFAVLIEAADALATPRKLIAAVGREKEPQ